MKGIVDMLPPGWIKVLRPRSKAKRSKKDPFYIDPESGYAFCSLKDVFRYIETNDFKSCLSKPQKWYTDTMASSEKRNQLGQSKDNTVETSDISGSNLKMVISSGTNNVGLTKSNSKHSKEDGKQFKQLEVNLEQRMLRGSKRHVCSDIKAQNFHEELPSNTKRMLRSSSKKVEIGERRSSRITSAIEVHDMTLEPKYNKQHPDRKSSPKKTRRTVKGIALSGGESSSPVEQIANNAVDTENIEEASTIHSSQALSSHSKKRGRGKESSSGKVTSVMEDLATIPENMDKKQCSDPISSTKKGFLKVMKIKTPRRESPRLVAQRTKEALGAKNNDKTSICSGDPSVAYSRVSKNASAKFINESVINENDRELQKDEKMEEQEAVFVHVHNSVTSGTLFAHKKNELGNAQKVTTGILEQHGERDQHTVENCTKQEVAGEVSLERGTLNLSSLFGDSWEDPCIEFAYKTLVGDMDTVTNEGSLNPFANTIFSTDDPLQLFGRPSNSTKPEHKPVDAGNEADNLNVEPKAAQK